MLIKNRTLSVDITRCRQCPHKTYDRAELEYVCSKSDRVISVMDFIEGTEIPEFCELLGSD